MSCKRWWFVLVPLLWVGTGLSQPAGDKKEQDAPKKTEMESEVEVKFSDGSSVRMSILQDNVDIVTRFGKLKVPMKEVRKIDFGVRLPEGTPQRIESALKRLGSESFKEREDALTELVKIGPPAFPSLQGAIKSPDAEVGKRAQEVIKRLKSKYPPEALRVVQEDRIVTNDFPIVGQIVSPVIKAQTPIFGPLDLKLPELRTIVWLSGNVEVEVTVDAMKYCNFATWMDTGVNIEQGAGVQIQAAGEVDLLPGNGPQFVSGPRGNFNVGGRFGPGNQWVPGMLLGRIGEKGTPFTIGERYNGVPTQEGRLYLQIVPGNFGGGQMPQGSYRVTINAGLHLRGS